MTIWSTLLGNWTLAGISLFPSGSFLSSSLLSSPLLSSPLLSSPLLSSPLLSSPLLSSPLLSSPLLSSPLLSSPFPSLPSLLLSLPLRPSPPLPSPPLQSTQLSPLWLQMDLQTFIRTNSLLDWMGDKGLFHLVEKMFKGRAYCVSSHGRVWRSNICNRKKVDQRFKLKWNE